MFLSQNTLYATGLTTGPAHQLNEIEYFGVTNPVDSDGGGLLDVGIYPLAFFSMLLGTPAAVKGSAHLGETGVDEQAAWVVDRIAAFYAG